MGAQDSGALLEVLVRKGILTNQEAEDVRADLVRDSNTIPSQVLAGGKATDRLSVGMRLQTQFASLNTNIAGAADPVATNHFFVRRVYLTLKAGLGSWGTVFTYDFASSGYNDAIVQWKNRDGSLNFDFGLRKLNLGYEERASSGNIKAIERSSVTRYFVGSNNGRRLGAASYRIGAFVDGVKGRFVYSAAITNPERTENFTLASEPGNSANNNFAYSGNVGLAGKLTNGNYLVGVGAGFFPDQGGAGNTNLGRGFDLALYSVYADVTMGRFGLMAEALVADVESGVAVGRDAKPVGFFIQPSLLVTDTLELVVRYGHVDSDGRGINLSDGIRSAPSGGTMNLLSEWYVGGNWYIKGNELKFQLGAVYGKSEDRPTGGPAEATAFGLRSQMQVQF